MKALVLAAATAVAVCAPLAAAAQPEETTPPPQEDPPPPPPPPAVPESVPVPAVQAAPTGTSSFMDTRLNFTCTHEDFFRDEKVLPTAPGFHCGRPNSLGILFFDNYDTRYTGFETLTHLALYKHYDAGNWDLEGGLVIRFNEFSEENIRLSDGGSYIRTAYWFDETRKRSDRIALVAFPVSSDRMRLGFSYRISWGGSPEFFKPNPDIPGSSGKTPTPSPAPSSSSTTTTSTRTSASSPRCCSTR